MKIQPGDIFQLKTTKGFAYIQYVREYDKPPYYGHLIRLLDGVYENIPDLQQITNKKEQFYIFIPLKFRQQQSFLESVGNYSIPRDFKIFPDFRVAGPPDRTTRIVSNWSLWQNGQETDIGKLPKKYYNLPTLGVWNIQGLITAIELGYLPKYDTEILGKDKGINLS